MGCRRVFRPISGFSAHDPHPASVPVLRPRTDPTRRNIGAVPNLDLKPVFKLAIYSITWLEVACSSSGQSSEGPTHWPPAVARKIPLMGRYSCSTCGKRAVDHLVAPLAGRAPRKSARRRGNPPDEAGSRLMKRDTARRCGRPPATTQARPAPRESAWRRGTQPDAAGLCRSPPAAAGFRPASSRHPPGIRPQRVRRTPPPPRVSPAPRPHPHPPHPTKRGPAAPPTTPLSSGRPSRVFGRCGSRGSSPCAG